MTSANQYLGTIRVRGENFLTQPRVSPGLLIIVCETPIASESVAERARLALYGWYESLQYFFPKIKAVDIIILNVVNTTPLV
jgi:hypothetical protein